MFEASFSNDEGKLEGLRAMANVDDLLNKRVEASPEEYTAALERCVRFLLSLASGIIIGRQAGCLEGLETRETREDET
jgi:hypothetical protein